MLYPLKFNPIYKDKIWGGQKLKTFLNKDFGKLPNCGETWEISGVQGELSVVSNGYLKGNNIQELVEIYMGELVGDYVYDKFGMEFPLLIKFIDANDVLSIQVHPDDKLSKERHSAYGKTEMWYVLQADKGAKLYSGFNKKMDQKTYLKSLEEGKIEEILNIEEPQEGDVFFLPAGRVHAIGAGLLLAEIQQTSDITYRIFDWNRMGTDGKPRELHTKLALDAIDYKHYEKYKTEYSIIKNETVNLEHCQYFTTNLLEFDTAIVKDYSMLDSFVIYMCLDGEFTIRYDENDEKVSKGETVLLPAELKNIGLIPSGNSKLLEVYIKKEKNKLSSKA
jgi:mannose-6-phosphate isomerase